MIPHIGSRTGPMVALSGPGEYWLWDDCQQKTPASLIGASWGETFKCLVGEVGSSGGDSVKRAVEWLAAIPEQRQTGFPRASAGGDAE